MCVTRKVFFKHQVNWNTVCGVIQNLPWLNIWFADNPVEALKKHLLLLVGRFVSTKFICMPNKDKPCFDDQSRHAYALRSRRLIVGGPVIALELTGKSLFAK